MGKRRNQRMKSLDPTRFQAATLAVTIQQAASDVIGAIPEKMNFGQVEGLEGVARAPTTIQLLWMSQGFEVRIGFIDNKPDVKAGVMDKLGVSPSLETQAKLEQKIRQAMNTLFPDAVVEGIV